MADNREHLLAKLNLVTKVRYEKGKLHRVRTVEAVTIVTDDGVFTPEQVAWYLENDSWEQDVVSTCGVDFCSTHINLGGAEADTDRMEAKDDEELELVQRTSVTLADLYRKGRARGVVSARTAYT